MKAGERGGEREKEALGAQFQRLGGKEKGMCGMKEARMPETRRDNAVRYILS